MKFIIAVAAFVPVVAMASLAQAGDDGPISKQMGWNNIERNMKESSADKHSKSVEECSKFIVNCENCDKCCRKLGLVPTAGDPTVAVPGYRKCKCITWAEKKKLTEKRRATPKYQNDIRFPARFQFEKQ